METLRKSEGSSHPRGPSSALRNGVHQKAGRPDQPPDIGHLHVVAQKVEFSRRSEVTWDLRSQGRTHAWETRLPQEAPRPLLPQGINGIWVLVFLSSLLFFLPRHLQGSIKCVLQTARQRRVCDLPPRPDVSKAQDGPDQSPSPCWLCLTTGSGAQGTSSLSRISLEGREREGRGRSSSRT